MELQNACLYHVYSSCPNQELKIGLLRFRKYRLKNWAISKLIVDFGPLLIGSEGIRSLKMHSRFLRAV
jgi:hypothetical protein